MAKRATRQWRINIVLAIILMITLCSVPSVFGSTPADSRALDVVYIDLPHVPGSDKMPGVPFPHDRHTRALGDDKDCSACHLQEKERFVFKFKRLTQGTPDADMVVYHDNCVACHVETKSAGKTSGPLDGDCRSCHTTASDDTSAWQPIHFDKSLHYRHVSAKAIKPGKMYDDANCSACHHIYDEVVKKTFHKPGTEESCFYCHKSEKTETAPAIRWASHASCVSCHQSIKARSQKTGPVECAGCHDAAAQQKIEMVEDIPRLERKQPDTVLLTSWMSPDGGSEEAKKKYMQPVAFNHVVHEQKADSCRSCHHQTLKKCAACHTEIGDEKGAGVQLARAMHSNVSTHSCVGCHKQAKMTKDCGGCHATMPQKQFSQLACVQCHAVDREQLGPFPMEMEARTAVAENSLNDRQRAALTLADKNIPEMVKIDSMVDKYEAVNFPHRQIVRAIFSRVKDNKMAAYFHGNDVTLCAGCHHNAPATLNPARCAACHGQAFANEQDGRPGLKGAYHGQCMACHKEMGIEEPAATDCIKCHKKKG